MQKLLFIFLIIISIKGFAQDPQLGDNSWYLQNVIISGEDNFAPVNAEITDVTLDFLVAAYDFDSVMCNSLSGHVDFYDGASSFAFTELNQTLVICGMSENGIYEAMYFNFYFANQSNPFTYSITSNSDSSETLIITSVNDDQAIYGNARLHVNQFEFVEIKTYPNPVTNELIIENKNSNSLNVNVYNMRGEHLFLKIIDNNSLAVLDVSVLKLGVYFFVLETDNQRKEIRKIIKQ